MVSGELDGLVTLPLLPLRDVVVFPAMPVSLIVGRERSVAAVRAAQRGEGHIMLVAQCEGETKDPEPADLFEFGTIGVITKSLELPDGTLKVVVEGRHRGRVHAYIEQSPFFQVSVERVDSLVVDPAQVQGLVRTIKEAFERYVKLNRAVQPEMVLAINAIEDPDCLGDSLVGALKLKLEERQQMLEAHEVHERLEKVYKVLLTEIEFLKVEKKLRGRVRRERENTQRDQWLNDQVKTIQKEMGDRDRREDIEELARAIAEKRLPTPIRDRASKELQRLSQMNTMSAEATVVRNYLDWILSLPWTNEAETCSELGEAIGVLNTDHYGLGKVKERIVEYLAVTQLVEKVQGPILCLVGPPGVGKTSLARSIARATGRPFARIALGGVRDEAAIRGHRRTYIGSMPGRLVQAMKRAGSVNPVLLLDEVDKMSSDIRGDPSSALLEVLDPEQNHAFADHYLDLDYDLSKVMFVCTANSLAGIPAPLIDRLEIIELTGYTEQEKLAIARGHLLDKQLELNGITQPQLEISNAALLDIIRRYTKESGVRELDRQLAKVCRKVARRVVHYGPETRVKVVTSNLEQLLGVPRYRFGQRETSDHIGLVKGLSVSRTGGELLNIEVAAIPGQGKLILTGKLGDVLKESASAVFTYTRARSDALGLEPDFHATQDFHIHYPGVPGGVEGPSAGIAMATALVSALTGIPVRSDTAMTGEITLRGRVLPIGGLREKVLAAHRGGITRVIVPEANRKDLPEIPKAVREDVEILCVSHMDRVLKEALSTEAAGSLFGAAVDPGGTGEEQLQVAWKI
jgi:ATP-dependent Lon protease